MAASLNGNAPAVEVICNAVLIVGHTQPYMNVDGALRAAAGLDQAAVTMLFAAALLHEQFARLTRRPTVLAEIYAEGIATGDATFETEVPTAEQMRSRWLPDLAWALIIVALIPLALKGVRYRAVEASVLLRDNILIFGFERRAGRQFEAQVDAVIMADPGLMAYASQAHPNLRLHLSVQGSATNPEAIKYYHQNFGIQRVVLPRVLSMGQVEQVCEQVPVQVEAGAPTVLQEAVVAGRAGVVLAPEDRKHDGLVLEMSVGANASLASLSQVLRFGLVDGEPLVRPRGLAHVVRYVTDLDRAAAAPECMLSACPVDLDSTVTVFRHAMASNQVTSPEAHTSGAPSNSRYVFQLPKKQFIPRRHKFINYKGRSKCYSLMWMNCEVN